MPLESVSSILMRLARNPWRDLVLRWNWKSAITSAVIRAAIFYFANLSAGYAAAFGAMQAEFLWRFAVAGFVGSVIQSVRKARPVWQAALVTSLALPLLNHIIEFTIHWLRGTPKLMASILASVCFTAVAMLFNAYAMRRGALIVGAEGKPLWRDILDMPSLIWGFILWLLRIQRSPQNS